MMSPAIDPMTFDELSELYRVEMKSASLTMPRKDLFKAMANLLTTLRQDYDRQMSVDPDSIMTEGAEQRRKKANTLCKSIMATRTKKIAIMALRGAEGAKNDLSCLTDEEREYYDSVLDLTKRQLAEIDRLRGKRVTIETRIDEPPVRDAIVEKEPEVPKTVIEEMPPIIEEEPFQEEMDGFPEEAFDEEPFDDVPPMPVETEVPMEPEIPEAPVEIEPEPMVESENDELVPILIRILEDLPAFAGPDRDYKLSKEDLVTLPKVLADVLINSEKAALIRPTP